MKTQFNVYMEVATAEEVRGKALQVGAPVGDLADFLLRFALSRIPDDTLRQWATQHRTSAGPLRGGLSKDERLVSMAFERLPKKAGQEGAWRFGLSDLASEAGLRLTNAFWALKALQARQVVHGMELEELDRWGRPVKSFWSLVSAMPEHTRSRG